MSGFLPEMLRDKGLRESSAWVVWQLFREGLTMNKFFWDIKSLGLCVEDGGRFEREDLCVCEDWAAELANYSLPPSRDL